MTDLEYMERMFTFKETAYEKKFFNDGEFAHYTLTVQGSIVKRDQRSTIFFFNAHGMFDEVVAH